MQRGAAEPTGTRRQVQSAAGKHQRPSTVLPGRRDPGAEQAQRKAFDKRMVTFDVQRRNRSVSEGYGFCSQDIAKFNIPGNFRTAEQPAGKWWRSYLAWFISPQRIGIYYCIIKHRPIDTGPFETISNANIVATPPFQGKCQPAGDRVREPDPQSTFTVRLIGTTLDPLCRQRLARDDSGPRGGQQTSIRTRYHIHGRPLAFLARILWIMSESSPIDSGSPRHVGIEQR